MAAGESVHYTPCPLCEAMCGLVLRVRDGRVTQIRPDQDDVWSKGYICPKGAVLGDLHADPDRLRAPLVRRGETWSEVSWQDAYTEIETRLRPVLEKHGNRALTAYIGNPTVHSYSLSRYIGAFIAMSGIPLVYSAGTVDQWPKNLVAALLYGGMWTIPVPDIDRTDYFLMLGANPSASQGSLMAAPDVLGRMDAIRRRGGKIVVVDPRRTATAQHADEWIPIRPGTDAALLLAMVHVLFAEHLVDLAHLRDRVNGVDDVATACRDFSPEAVAETCRIDAATIRRLAREVAKASSAAVYGRIGTCTQEFGTLASWLVEVLAVLTGNLDRAGGTMFADPIVPSLNNLRPPEFAAGFELHRFASRVRGAPEVLGQVPVSCLAEEITTPGEGQIRALFTIAGNPVISAPDSARLDAALPRLDCMVSLDNYLNETTRHAHVILPGLSPLEQPHCDDLIWNWSVRNAARYADPVFAPPQPRPAEWEVLLVLAALAAGQRAAEIDVDVLDELFFGGVVGVFAAQENSRIHGRDPADIAARTPGRGPDRLTDFMIRIGPRGDAYANGDGLTLERLRSHRHGLDGGPLVPRLDSAVTTESGRIELAPAYILADLDRLRARLRRAEPGLLLISRRHLRSNNSWVHNVDRLVSGRDRCTLLIHPEDARASGVSDGERVHVTSAAGSVEVPVTVSDEMMPGVVSLPHGWGHDRAGSRLSVAARHAGVNNNLLAPGHLVDVPSGNAVVNGIPVSVAPLRRA